MTLLFIDHAIFGNGYGMATPHCDGTFYWLSGDLYHWSGWLGAQLKSYQWTHPRAGERRKLAGVEFRPSRSDRNWGRVAISWTACCIPQDLNEANAFLRALKSHLGDGQHIHPFCWPAQAIEAHRAETESGSVHESAVRQDAPGDTCHD